MKKLILFCLMIGFCSSIFAQTNSDAVLQDKEKTSVLYFHYTRRCITCQTVEKEAKNALQSMFAEQYNSSEIDMQSINLDDAENEALANQWNVSGQTLLIVKGDRKIDLTSKAFMYARTNPEKYHQEISEAIKAL